MYVGILESFCLLQPSHLFKEYITKTNNIFEKTSNFMYPTLFGNHKVYLLNAMLEGGGRTFYLNGRGSAIEHVLYFKCHRKYHNGSATENTELDIFCDTYLKWELN